MVVGFQGEQEDKAIPVMVRLKTKAAAVCRENRKLIQETFREWALFSKICDIMSTSNVILLRYLQFTHEGKLNLFRPYTYFHSIIDYIVLKSKAYVLRKINL